MGAEAAESLADAYDDVRRRVYLRHGGYCTYCGRVLLLHEARLDHDARDTEWHRASEDTLRCACSECHRDRGLRTRAEYRAHRRMLHAHQMLRSLNGR